MAKGDPTWQSRSLWELCQYELSQQTPVLHHTVTPLLWLLLGPTSSNCDFHGPPHSQETQQNEESASFKCFTWSMLVPWYVLPCTSERFASAWKTLESKKEPADTDSSACHFHWLGSGPIAEAQLEEKRTQAYRETERNEGGRKISGWRSFSLAGHRSITGKVGEGRQTQTEKGHRGSGSEEYFSVAWNQPLSMRLSLVSLLHHDMKVLNSKHSWALKVGVQHVYQLSSDHRGNCDFMNHSQYYCKCNFKRMN